LGRRHLRARLHWGIQGADVSGIQMAALWYPIRGITPWCRLVYDEIFTQTRRRHGVNWRGWGAGGGICTSLGERVSLSLSGSLRNFLQSAEAELRWGVAQLPLSLALSFSYAEGRKPLGRESVVALCFGYDLPSWRDLWCSHLARQPLLWVLSDYRVVYSSGHRRLD